MHYGGEAVSGIIPSAMKPLKNIDEVYLGHTIVKRHTQIDNCHYIDVGSSYTQQLCIVKIK